jgi:small-conductance mechanosensitive channel
MRLCSRAGLGYVLLLGAGAWPAAAQAPGAPEAPAATADTASLVIRNRHIITFRAHYLGRPPSTRAGGAVERVTRAFAERRPRDTVGMAMLGDIPAVFIGDRPIFTVTQGDVDPLTNTAVDVAAREAAGRLAEAWGAMIEERSARQLVRGAVFAVAATGLFLLIIVALRRLTRRLRARVEADVERRAGDVKVGGVTVLHAGFLLIAARRAVLLLGGLALLFAAYLWLTFVLEQFPWTRPAGQALGGFLLRTVGNLLAGIAAAVPGLIVVAMIFVFTRWFSRLVRGFFLAVEQGRAQVPWMHPETAEPTRRLVGGLIWVFAIVASYPYLPGSDTDIFKGISVLVGLMLSIGSGSLIGQAMSGLALMYARALRRGDVVRIDDAEGIVTSLGMLSTKLMTPRGEEVTIPNGVVIGTKTVNLSRGGLEAPLCTSVTIGYDTPWRQVEAMLLEAARRTPDIDRGTPPVVLMRSLGDFAVLYELRAAPTEPAARGRILSALHGHVLDVFNEQGVQIMTPSYESDPAEAKIVPPGRWRAGPVPATQGDDGTSA